jgi:hypothetical protein
METKKSINLKKIISGNYLGIFFIIWYIMVFFVLFFSNILFLENIEIENGRNNFLEKIFIVFITSVFWPIIFCFILLGAFLLGAEITPILIGGGIIPPVLHIFLIGLIAGIITIIAVKNRSIRTFLKKYNIM